MGLLTDHYPNTTVENRLAVDSGQFVSFVLGNRVDVLLSLADEGSDPHL